MDYAKIIEDVNTHVGGGPDRLLLAGGNCGIFALSMSKALLQKNIAHNVLVATDRLPKYNRGAFIKSYCWEMIERRLDADHVAIQTATGDVIDFQGVTTINDLKFVLSSWRRTDHNIFICSPHDPDLRKYILRHTARNLSQATFDLAISKSLTEYDETVTDTSKSNEVIEP